MKTQANHLKNDETNNRASTLPPSETDGSNNQTSKSPTKGIPVPLNFSIGMWAVILLQLFFTIKESMVAGSLSIASLYLVRRFWAPWASRSIGHTWCFFAAIPVGLIIFAFPAIGIEKLTGSQTALLLWFTLPLAWLGYAYRGTEEEGRVERERIAFKFKENLGASSDWDLSFLNDEKGIGFAVSEKLQSVGFFKNGTFDFKPFEKISGWEIKLLEPDYETFNVSVVSDRKTVATAAAAAMLTQMSMDKKARKKAEKNSGLFFYFQEKETPSIFQVQSTDIAALKHWNKTLKKILPD